jgi:hypothetical protein
MRSCFQEGTGPGPFTAMIESFHYHRYDKLHIQYLEMIKSQCGNPVIFLAGKYEPFGLFNDRNGYSGYIPTPRYFRNCYERFMDEYASKIDQHMAMLPAWVLSIDHSHKVRC